MREISFGQNSDLLLEKILADLRYNIIAGELSKIGQPRNIIDFGCGYRGNFLLKLIKRFPGIKSAAGVDLSVIKESTDPKIKLIEASLEKTLPLPSDYYDAAVSAATIEHLKNPKIFLSEARRVLKNGGGFILTTPSPCAKRVLEILSLKLKLLESREINDHKNYFSAGQLKALLAAANFKDINIQPFQFGFNLLVKCKK